MASEVELVLKAKDFLSGVADKATASLKKLDTQAAKMAKPRTLSGGLSGVFNQQIGLGSILSVGAKAMTGLLGIVTSVVGKIAGMLVSGFGWAAKAVGQALMTILSTAASVFGTLIKTVTGALGHILGFATKWGLYLGAAVGAGFVLAIREGAKFETAMANVWAMVADRSRPEIDKMGVQVRKLAVELGQDATEMAMGLYDIVSAGVTEPAKALEMLAVSAKAAIAGLSDTKTAANAFTTAMAVYGDKVKDVADMADLYFAIVEQGKLTFGDLAYGMGQILGVAKGAGQSIEQVGAAVALVSRVMPVGMAWSGLRNVMMTLADPKAQKQLAKLGVTVLDNTGKMKGLVDITNQIAKQGLTTTQLGPIFGNLGISVVNAMTSQAGAAGGVLDSMTNRSGKNAAAMAKQWETVAKQLQILWVTVKDFGLAVFSAIRGDLVGGLQAANTWVKNVHDSFIAWLEGVDFANAKRALLDFVKGGLGQVSAWVRSVDWGTVWDTIAQTAQAAAGKVATWWGKLVEVWPTITAAGQTAWASIKDAAAASWAWVEDKQKQFANWLAELGSLVPEDFAEKFPIDKILEKAADWAITLGKAMLNLIGMAAEFGRTMLLTIKDLKVYLQPIISPVLTAQRAVVGTKLGSARTALTDAQNVRKSRLEGITAAGTWTPQEIAKDMQKYDDIVDFRKAEVQALSKQWGALEKQLGAWDALEIGINGIVPQLERVNPLIEKWKEQLENLRAPAVEGAGAAGEWLQGKAQEAAGTVGRGLGGLSIEERAGGEGGFVPPQWQAPAFAPEFPEMLPEDAEFIAPIVREGPEDMPITPAAVPEEAFKSFETLTQKAARLEAERLKLMQQLAKAGETLEKSNESAGKAQLEALEKLLAHVNMLIAQNRGTTQKAKDVKDAVGNGGEGPG